VPWDLMEIKASIPRYYFDLAQRAERTLPRGESAYTPAVRVDRSPWARALDYIAGPSRWRSGGRAGQSW